MAARLATAQWVEPPRNGWVQVSIYHHDTKTVYNSEAQKQRIFAGGHAITTSTYLTAAGGLVRGIDAWLQVPVHRLQFNNAGGERDRIGLGDTRLYLRASPEVFGFRRLPVAVRGGVKLPGGDFPVDAEIIPLGEGQRDWELMLELGASLYPFPFYVLGWAGYRWRERNDEIDWKPGDERFAFAAAGGQFGIVSWKVAAEGWSGGAARIQGIRIVSARRDYVQFLPSVGTRLGPGTLEVGARLPLGGRNLPAGPAFVLGYFTRWSWR